MRRLNSSPRITERLASRVKGLTAIFCVLLLTIRPEPASGRPRDASRRGKTLFDRRQTHELLRMTHHDTATSRNPAGDLRPRHQGAEGVRQSAGGPRLDRALSDRRGPACPSRRVPVRPPRHADHPGAAGGADGAGRPAMRRRRHRAVGPGGDLHHPARGAEGRRSSPGLRQRLSPDAQFLQRHAARATASRPPISIR